MALVSSAPHPEIDMVKIVPTYESKLVVVLMGSDPSPKERVLLNKVTDGAVVITHSD